MKRVLRVSAVLIILGLCIWASWHREDLKNFPQIISSYYSKQFCSCYFVMKQGEDRCHEWTRQWVPIQSFELDRENKQVRVRGLFRTSTASYAGGRQGCFLVE